MWLLILAIVLLLFSSLLSAYMAKAYGKPRHERPSLMWKHEVKLGCINFVLFITGIGMLVIVVGWWGLAGIAIYWLLVVFVLMPIGMQRLLLLIFRQK